jgi:hypothetical protein
MPGSLCTGDCEVDVIRPEWDVERFLSEKRYQTATYANQQRNWSDTNMFSNGTVRTNSTYNGPNLIQTVFDAKANWALYPEMCFNLMTTF